MTKLLDVGCGTRAQSFLSYFCHSGKSIIPPLSLHLCSRSHRISPSSCIKHPLSRGSLPAGLKYVGNYSSPWKFSRKCFLPSHSPRTLQPVVFTYLLTTSTTFPKASYWLNFVNIYHHILHFPLWLFLPPSNALAFGICGSTFFSSSFLRSWPFLSSYEYLFSVYPLNVKVSRS